MHIDAPLNLHQLFAWDVPERDPRGWVIAVAYFALVEPDRLLAAASSHRVALGQVDLRRTHQELEVQVTIDGERVNLAFDHEQILCAIFARLRPQLATSSVALDALPARFTLRQLQQVFEGLLGARVNKDSFRRSVLSRSLIQPTGPFEDGVGHRPGRAVRTRSLAQRG